MTDTEKQMFLDDQEKRIAELEEELANETDDKERKCLWAELDYAWRDLRGMQVGDFSSVDY